MQRKIIKIDQDQCNGCGLCAQACKEGAIGMINGKATLLRDDYCDGLGNCLPVCPAGAISFEIREAAEFNENAVESAAVSHFVKPVNQPLRYPKAKMIHKTTEQPHTAEACRFVSELKQWPVQLKLVPVKAPYLNHAKLLVAADCTAYAYAAFHTDFMKGKVTLIGCPKLDEGDYADKLTALLENNEIEDITVVRMDVPCCGGIVNSVKKALENSRKIIPWQLHTITANGELLR